MSNLNTVLRIRIDSDTKDALDNLAKERGHKKTSPLIREAIKLLLKGDRPDPRELTAELLNWRNEMHRVGTNLNRLTHHLNMALPISTEEIQKTQAQLLKIYRVMTERFEDLENELRT